MSLNEFSWDFVTLWLERLKLRDFPKCVAAAPSLLLLRSWSRETCNRKQHQQQQQKACVDLELVSTRDHFSSTTLPDSTETKKKGRILIFDLLHIGQKSSKSDKCSPNSSNIDFYKSSIRDIICAKIQFWLYKSKKLSLGENWSCESSWIFAMIYNLIVFVSKISLYFFLWSKLQTSWRRVQKRGVIRHLWSVIWPDCQRADSHATSS